jgi:PAS domain S-box-containing protein
MNLAHEAILLDTAVAPYATLLEAINTGAALVDREARLVRVNRRLAMLAGLSPGELVGRTLFDLYAADPDARDRLVDVLEHFDERREHEYYLPQLDGTRLPVIVSGGPVGGEPPLSDYRLITVTSIAVLKEHEARLQDQYETITNLSNTILDQALKLRDSNEVLEERVRERTRELREANLDTIYMLAIASEAKDEDTGRHVRRIEALARRLAREVGLSPSEAQDVGTHAVLHDVGKLHVPDQILNKPGPLTPDEREVIQQHTLAGERILGGNPFFDRARRIARSHHENWDGTGYPDRLAGRDIPLDARIVHLADVYDALTQPRVYKKAWRAEDAMGVIRESRGLMFEPDLVDAFASLWDRELRDGTTAVG